VAGGGAGADVPPAKGWGHQLHIFPLLPRALPTDKKVESGTSRNKSGTFDTLSDSEDPAMGFNCRQTAPGGMPRGQTMLKGHLPGVTYHTVY